MTDNELLELAAKAAGIGGIVYAESRGGWDEEHALPAILYYSNGQRDAWGKGWWNPLTDDGDAFRLAVKLRLELRQYLNQAESFLTGTRNKHKNAEFYAGDPYAATRRAIVRAAAEIGKERK